MRVLGIDPGSRVMGLGVVDTDGEKMRSIYSDSVKLGGGELSGRLGKIFEAVSIVIKKYDPDSIAIEQVFMAKNAKSALTLGHARGAAICAAVMCSMNVSEYAAREIKQAVVGSGGATKEQVQHMVRILLGLTTAPLPDSADALACAICHINTSLVARRVNLHGVAQ